MKIYLREISENTKDFHFTENDEWIRNAVAAADEEGAVKALTKLRPAHLALPKRHAKIDFHVRILDKVIFVTGEFDTELHLLCSRCGKPFLFHADHHFEALLTQDREMAGEPESDDLSKQFGKAHQGRVKLESELEITHLREDFVDLSQVLTEQLVLQVPFQPVCKDDCKGICFQCGADLNEGSCKCERLGHPAFAALKGWGKKKDDLEGFEKDSGPSQKNGGAKSFKEKTSEAASGPQAPSPFASLKGFTPTKKEPKKD
jgi:uncharacterized protein